MQNYSVQNALDLLLDQADNMTFSELKQLIGNVSVDRNVNGQVVGFADDAITCLYSGGISGLSVADYIETLKSKFRISFTRNKTLSPAYCRWQVR